MKVILLENVIGLGRAGEVKTVKDGFARNYLIPQKFAELATRKKQSQIERMQAVLAQKAKQTFDSSMQKKDEMEKEVITIKKKAGEERKLFGSVTNSDVAEALTALGYEIERRKIVFSNVKELGEYSAKVKLDEGVTAEVKVIVEDENANDEVVEEVKTKTTDGYFVDEDEEDDDDEIHSSYLDDETVDSDASEETEETEESEEKE